MASTVDPEPPIPFNRPSVSGREAEYVDQIFRQGRFGSNGPFAGRCVELLQAWTGSPGVLLTPSCTASLELAALLCNFQPGDEVILPSFTFVSTASAFLRAGARLVFVDVCPDTLNIHPAQVEQAMTPRTRAICPVHYAGVGCDMDRLMALAARRGLRVVEDAAQGVGAYYRDRPLGTLGDFGCYSFHDTKNLQCGEGGALVLRDPELLERAEILREKGTNRSKFFRGEVDKYTWVDVGSSFVLSELNCAFLAGQLEQLESITARRLQLFETYHTGFREVEQRGLVRRPIIPSECRGNGHIYYLLLGSEAARDGLIQHLRTCRIHAVFHYVPLHSSPLGIRLGGDRSPLPVTDDVSSRLVRLPMYFGLTPEQQQRVIDAVNDFLLSPAN